MLQLFARKKLFVNRHLQGTITLRFVYYWAIYHLSVWHGAFMYFFLKERLIQLTGGGQMRSVKELYSHFMHEYTPIIAAAVFLVPIVIYELIRQTHRFAGPLVRFSNAMKDVMAGKPVKQIKLRDGDLLGEFETLFNEFLAFHHAKVEEAAAKSTPAVPAMTAEEESQLVASNAAM